MCVGGGGCRVVLPERPWCVRAAKTPASLCALESAHPYKWTLFIYQRREMMKLWIINGGEFDEISSFIAYAQSIYLTCMSDCASLSGGMHA